MVTARQTGSVCIDDASLDYNAAASVALTLERPHGFERRVIVDVSTAERATTAGLARLVVLRRQLLEEGRDLCLYGLAPGVSDLLRINRLATILPIA